MTGVSKRIFYSLLAVIFLLSLLHFTAFLAAYYELIHYNDFFFQYVNFDEEKNLPSIFSSLLHLTAAVLLGLIGSSSDTNRNRRFFWWTLSFIFVFLALDELLRIHEMAGRNLSKVLDTSGVFHYSWIIPYGFAVTLIGLLLLKPVLELPPMTKNRFILSGVIFLSGAIGIEMATGWLISFKEMESMQLIIVPEFFFLYTLEELLEMTGVSFFIFSLLEFRSSQKKSS